MEEGTSKQPRVGTGEEKKYITEKIRKSYLKNRDATKVCLYEQFERWLQLKEELKAKTHKEVAAVLLDSYYRSTKETSKTRYLMKYNALFVYKFNASVYKVNWENNDILF